MNLLLTFIGILVLGFVLNVILKQTYNFIFFIGKKPVVWALVFGLVTIVFWFICASFGWSVSTPAWASTMAFFMNLPSSSSKGAKELANEMYSEMGIKNGALFYRIGLGIFVVSAIASWVVFYGHVCNSAGQCSGLFE